MPWRSACTPQGIDPFNHDDPDVDAILEREHDWQGDDWLGED